MKTGLSEAAETVYLQLTGDDDGRVCRDIPESACDEQPGNFLKHVVSLGALALGVASAIGLGAPGWLRAPLLLPGVLFVLMVAYQGVRFGRSTHLVDMADADRRAAYTALSNTAIGVLLVAGGAFGFVAEAFGEAVLIGVFAALCVLAAVVARGLDEVRPGGS